MLNCFGVLRKRQLLLLVLVVVCGWWLVVGFHYRGLVSIYGHYYSRITNETNDVCLFPNIDPWDPSIDRYTKGAPQYGNQLHCKQVQPELSYLAANGSLVLNQTAIDEVGRPNLNCHYRCFDGAPGDDDMVRLGESIQLSNWAQPNCEFVEVECRCGLLPFYKNHHNQIIRPEYDIGKNSTSTAPSVILFVLDSVSQSNFKRNLPKTYRVLTQLFGAHVFQGFTKVGDNSRPNAIAFLTGKRSGIVGEKSELPEDMSQEFADDWPFIWKDFKAANYATYYAEDMPKFNLFRYLAKGFRRKPVDHYFRPFWLQTYNSFVHRMSTYLCYGNTPMHSLQLNYLRDFLVKYGREKRPQFALNWLTGLGHEWLNQVSLGDTDIAQFFIDMHTNLKDSFLFVLSDHGHRFDAIRESVVGRTEERMPFVSMALPVLLRERHPELTNIIRRNSHQLTNFWDLYVTLRDILSLSSDSRQNEGTFVRQRNWRRLFGAERGLSLLRPILQRSCRSAGIADEFCVCQHDAPVNVSEPAVRIAADVLLTHVNQLLTASVHCAPLRLRRVRHARMSMPNAALVLHADYSLFRGGRSPSGFQLTYRLLIETTPGGALLEAMLRHDVTTGTTVLVGDVARINRYGNQSHCVLTARLKKYCYCSDPDLPVRSLLLL